MKSPASVAMAPRRSSPRSACQWTSSRPVPTWCPGPKSHPGKTGKGNPYLKSVLGEAAASAGRTNTFLGARYRRLARRIGKLKALVAVARSILVIVWHLLADPTRRYRCLLYTSDAADDLLCV